MSLKDIERGIQCLKKAFLLLSHIPSWLRICLFESKDQIVFSTEPEAFRGVGSATDLKLYFPFVKTHFHSPYNSLVKEK